MVNTKSVPSDRTIIDHLRLATDWDAAKARVGNRFEPDLQIPRLVFEPDILEDELSDLLIRLGPVSWRSKTDLTVYGLSLSYNPDHPRDTWTSASFGHTRYQGCHPYEYYKAVERDRLHRVKGDYLDSYGFRCLLPEIAQYPALQRILSGFTVPIVRTTVRVLNGFICQTNGDSDSGMHRDDSPFEVLRINLCVTNDGSFGYQYRGFSPRYPTPGNHWVVNSDQDHRVVVSKKSNFQRMHLVIGLAPWFDYDASADAWLPNQWFGHKHPYDMASEGLLFKHTGNTYT